MATKKPQTYTYGIPVNESVDGGSVTVLSVQITDDVKHRRFALLRGVLCDNYNVTRAEAAKCIRAMAFDTL